MVPEAVQLDRLLSGSLGDLSRDGRWSVAAIAVAGGQTGYWLSDAQRTSTFEIGSVTKTMTALALADMVTKGELASRTGWRTTCPRPRAQM